MQDFYLKFDNQEQAQSILFDGETPNYANIDVIGTMYEPTGTMIETEDGNIPEVQAIDGWHVNVRVVGDEDMAALEPFAVAPSTGRRRWSDAPTVVVPIAPQYAQVITIRQARLALHNAGLLDDVEAAIAQADRAVQIEWEYATEFRRDWPTLLAMQPLLGLTDEQIDGLFVAASAL